jgi:hypothetical protein
MIQKVWDAKVGKMGRLNVLFRSRNVQIQPGRLRGVQISIQYDALGVGIGAGRQQKQPVHLEILSIEHALHMARHIKPIYLLVQYPHNAGRIAQRKQCASWTASLVVVDQEILLAPRYQKR